MNKTPLIATPEWTRLEKPIYPWVRTLERILISTSPPAMTGPDIYIATDYSGNSKSSLYDVATVLYVDLDRSREWEAQRQVVRSKYLGDGRRISFKALNDRHRRAALVPFLHAANSIHGVVATVAIRKSIVRLCTDELIQKYAAERISLNSEWSFNAFERMVRIAHLVSVMIGGLSRKSQNIFWISDEDEMFANSARSEDVREIISRYSSNYVKHSLGQLGVGTTRIDEGDRFDEDLNSVADLISGAVAEVTTKVAQCCGGKIPAPLSLACEPNLSPKAEVLFSWFCDQRYCLRRAAMVIDRQLGSRLNAFKFEMRA